MQLAWVRHGKVVQCLRNVEQLHATAAMKGFLMPIFSLWFRLCLHTQFRCLKFQSGDFSGHASFQSSKQDRRDAEKGAT
jgi:hypothetical protein